MRGFLIVSIAVAVVCLSKDYVNLKWFLIGVQLTIGAEGLIGRFFK